MRLLRFRSAILALVGGLAVIVLPAAPASAAYPTCNRADNVTSPYGLYLVPTYSGTLNCLLRQGDYNNKGVMALQRNLNICYNQGISIDGDFGPGTEAALMNAQRWMKVVHGKDIAVDGVYGPETRRALFWPTPSGCVIVGR
jgi:peptidoglycan hydrolase-like protein with peptidoglycan-binding domain